MTMVLFIADEPFIVEQDSADPMLQRVEIRLRVAITEPTVRTAPPPSAGIEFILDTGADYATLYHDDLAGFGISTDNGPVTGWVNVTVTDGHETEGPLRAVTLWLYSNLTGQDPHPVYLKKGVLVLEGAQKKMRPLLGMNSLLDAGLHIMLDAGARRFSAWVPSEQA